MSECSDVPWDEDEDDTEDEDDWDEDDDEDEDEAPEWIVGRPVSGLDSLLGTP